MPYTSNPNAPRARTEAARLVKLKGWTQEKAAHYTGVGQGTISKWCAKAPRDLRLLIPTESSRPHSSPNALPKETVDAIRAARLVRNRCAEVIHDDLKDLGIIVSLSSVKRTLKKLGLTKRKSKWKRIHPPIPRPPALYPGALVQMDTVHFVDWSTSRRFYIYTIIDLKSR